MSKKVMKLINPYTGAMECKVCGATHFALIKPSSNGKYYRGAWQCHYGCKLPEKTSRGDLIKKVLRLQLTILKAQSEYEMLRKSDKWNELPEERRNILDEMSGGIWLIGNEKAEIELKMRNIKEMVERGEN